VSRDDLPRDRFGHRRASRLARFGTILDVAVEVPGHGWLALRAPWPDTDPSLIWRLIAQTLILYAIVLIPVLWIGRRISLPLKSLGDAARRFRPGDHHEALVESGPPDVREVTAAFNALRLRVTAMLDEKDRMLGAIGHDLRTPLAALRVRIESVDDDTDRTRMADIIAEMDRTLDDILSLARLGRPSEPPIDVDLTALVDAVVEDFRDLDHDVVFEDGTRLPIKLRPGLMRRAVRNLIENAVKYGHSAIVRIETTTDRVRIVVADRGPGIPAERLGDVFDPFTRLETSRNRETGGIGLGLALARAIVADAGGEIRLENRAEGGLDATIDLPR
jgi:signal transduction histidine kinase